MEKPTYCENEHLVYLDELRESGITNMFGAGSYLNNVYPKLTRDESRKVLSYWMETFTDRDGA